MFSFLNCVRGCVCVATGGFLCCGVGEGGGWWINGVLWSLLSWGVLDTILCYYIYIIYVIHILNSEGRSLNVCNLAWNIIPLSSEEHLKWFKDSGVAPWDVVLWKKYRFFWRNIVHAFVVMFKTLFKIKTFQSCFNLLNICIFNIK